MTTTSVNQRSPFLIDIGNNKVVKLQLKASSMDSGLRTTLGITALPDSGEIPTGKILVGSGRDAAMRNGCFEINLVYESQS